MIFLKMAMRNVFRNRGRALLTILGCAVTILAFVLIRTLLAAWSVGADYAAKDRIATRHKVSFIVQMPKKYIDDVRNTPGVTKATYMNWFGARDPRRPDEFFANMAVDPKSFLDVYTECSISEEDKQRWLGDKQGALLGDVLARKLGVKVGDKITLEGTIYPGDWEFHVSGIYTATEKSLDRSQFLFHWDYMNDALPAGRKDEIGWIAARIDDPKRSASIAAAIDRTFEERDTQTVTMSERAMNLSFMAMVSALLKALNVVSIIILLIMMMILGNTIAMGVRERTREFAVLRAVGFRPGHVVGFIVGEALLLGLLGGLAGLGLSIPVVEWSMGQWIEENMGSWFPYFRIDTATKGLA
ncbi:MAG: ABC transporter permease, partial [Myxococcales bacterium]|nr:ABC transporter permease [Myxococcales bacterium]